MKGIEQYRHLTGVNGIYRSDPFVMNGYLYPINIVNNDNIVQSRSDDITIFLIRTQIAHDLLKILK